MKQIKAQVFVGMYIAGTSSHALHSKFMCVSHEGITIVLVISITIC